MDLKRRARAETGVIEKDLPTLSELEKMNTEAVSEWIKTLIGSNGACPPGVSRRNFLKKYIANFKDNPSSKVLPSNEVDDMDDKEVTTWIKKLIGTSGCCKSIHSMRTLLKDYIANCKKRAPAQGDIKPKGHTQSGWDDSNRHPDTESQIASDSVDETYDSLTPIKNLPSGNPLNIILIGKTGHGKSATANSIFDEEKFESAMSFVSRTSKCKMEISTKGGREIRLVDTPGTMDTRHTDETLKELGTAIAFLPEGVDTFVLVLSIQARLTEEEKTAIHKLKETFGPNILSEYGVIVFTHKDSFMKESKKTGITFEEYIKSETGDMQTLLQECSFRCVPIDNSEEDPAIRRDQVIEIITKIDKLVVKNNGKRYTNVLFKSAGVKRAEVQQRLDKQKEDIERKMDAEIQAIRDKYKPELKTIEEQQMNVVHEVGTYIADEIKESFGCFPANALVTLHDDRTITIADLCIGHKVLSNAVFGTLTYSEVYFFAHLNPKVTKQYINLRSSTQNMKLTPEHHVYIVRKGHMQTIAAREVKLGDIMLVLNKEIKSLVEDPVKEIYKSIEVGIYAPITMSGTIIVNNVLASCYVDIVPPIYSHQMLWPMRQTYRLSPSLAALINNEGKEGMPTWVQYIMDILLN